MKLTLVRPTLELKEKALDYRQEHFDNNEFLFKIKPTNMRGFSTLGNL